MGKQIYWATSSRISIAIQRDIDCFVSYRTGEMKWIDEVRFKFGFHVPVGMSLFQDP